MGGGARAIAGGIVRLVGEVFSGAYRCAK